MQNNRHKQGIKLKQRDSESDFFIISFLNQSVPSDKHSNGQYSKTRILTTVENKIQNQEAITV